MSTHLLTFAQACERLHVSDKTLRAVIARGELRAGEPWTDTCQRDYEAALTSQENSRG